MGDTDVTENNNSKGNQDQLYSFEKAMIEEYRTVINPYSQLFDELGYELKIELGWINSLKKEWSKQPLPIKNGYECYVYCIVEKNGRIVQIKSNDGEADYYSLIASWMISSVVRHFQKLVVKTYPRMDDDVADNLNGFLLQLRNKHDAD